MNIAIVTGASSGLGLEFVKQISTTETLDEIWVIARREKELSLIHSLVSTKIRVLPMDLTHDNSILKIKNLLNELKPNIFVLINAAGFGKIGNYEEITLSDIDKMLLLNCKAAVDITQIVLPYIKKHGRIINICSTAAFQPMQSLGVYAASKSFLLNYSRALHWELLTKSIHVSAVCPYWIKDTEFIPIAQKTANGKAVKHFPLAGSSKTIVYISLLFSKANFPVITPGIVCTIHRISCKIIPRFFMQGIWELIRRI